ncbi:hypothetical protein BDP55DRAFT_631138 [Colletotrichum godetiae]|uniref:Uncharacterized protein n=1 Tax=Colletotrichum godetiae TaxID=1209918 RepID=A0AAJ0EUS2_9PEZI|nr:uncharacterized protein BDP55DRAFT_631138 [Colletotrichum godetiae]KAK1676507.1 hypothetical protein BDP55DRAFT_631138 [Colletotrichum godetiae]
MDSTKQQEPDVGIISIWNMGWVSRSFSKPMDFELARVARTEATIRRAEDADVDIVSSDMELVERASVVLSVVPPRDAMETAQRVVDALHDLATCGSRPIYPLYFIDLNAVAPSTVRGIAQLFASVQHSARFIAGSILGEPPVWIPANDLGPKTASPTTAISGVKHGFGGLYDINIHGVEILSPALSFHPETFISSFPSNSMVVVRLSS